MTKRTNTFLVSQRYFPEKQLVKNCKYLDYTRMEHFIKQLLEPTFIRGPVYFYR